MSECKHKWKAFETGAVYCEKCDVNYIVFLESENAKLLKVVPKANDVLKEFDEFGNKYDSIRASLAIQGLNKAINGAIKNETT